MQLVIVESPTKAKTIQKFLGKDFLIKSSFGHVRDLPRTKLGVDVEKNFEPQYVIPTKAKKVVAELKKDAKKADETILATDEDREGESISWHLQEALGLKNPKRIVFHEITKTAIEHALEHPRSIDMHLVNAQQARRVLDRIVGYKLSPFLWKKVAKGLSAGRVQSVAVRLVVEKEEERKKFAAQEYWSVEALLKKGAQEFPASLVKKDGQSVDKLDIKNAAEAEKILKDLENAIYTVASVEKKETRKNPAAPFTTSTLQQASWQRFKYPAKMTMSLAQRLYEEGLITYHRTDSLNLAESALSAAKDFILKEVGEKFWAGKFVHYKTKDSSAQQAHEAIRPSYPEKTPDSLKDSLEPRQLKVYTLIWQRFIASQMAPAIFDSVGADIAANNYTFRANGQTIIFEGFLKVYPNKIEDTTLPDLKEKDTLNLLKLEHLQHFTEPPARYNEATLIKALEKAGVGRPSTYAPTLSTIQTRNYVAKDEQKRFMPTEMGTLVTDMLVKNFPEIVDINFTAKLEKELDEVSEGKDTWQKTCQDFYTPFAKNLEEKYTDVKKENTDIATDKVCPKCGKPLIEKMGRFGRFYACTGFPECKHTESVATKDSVTGITCPKCKTGQVTSKRTKKGKIFYGCNTFPKCDFALWDKPNGELCPKCDSLLVEKGKKILCSNKECDFKK